MRKFLWLLVALTGAFAVGGIALHRGETINAMWLVVAAICVYAIGYRFYSAWIAAKVLERSTPTRATPAERLNNGRDFVPTQPLDRVRPSLRGDRRPGSARSARRSRRSSAICPARCGSWSARCSAAACRT